MATFISVVALIFSALHFIAVYGCYRISKEDWWDVPPYIYHPVLSKIPLICGFILPVIPFSIVFPIHWGIIFVINIILVSLFWSIPTKLFLWRWKSTKGLGYDTIFALKSGIVIFFIGLIIHLIWVI